MGNPIANTRNAADDEGQIYVAVDRRGVILDLPEEAGVASLRLTRGRVENVAGSPFAGPLPPVVRRSAMSASSSFWLRLRRRITSTRAAG